MLALAGVVWLTHGVRIRLGPLTLSATSPARMAMQASLLLAIRYGVSASRAEHGYRHARFLAALLLLLVTLAAGSSPRRVGDGGEYLAMAMNLSTFSRPAISPDQRRDIEQTFNGLGESFAGVSLANPGLQGTDGRQDFVHFWFYSLLAVPFLWIVRIVGLHPNVGFTLLNLVLLGWSAWVVSRRVRTDVVLLLFAGPIIWWVDKGHTEPFTFAFLAVALALVTEAPGAALVCIGAAGTQNPVIALTLPAVAAVVLIARPALRRDPRFWAGAGAGLALTVLHPLYYWMRLGRLSPLEDAAFVHLPGIGEWLTPVVDPTIGILPNFPGLLVAVILATVMLLTRAPTRLRRLDVVVALVMGMIFLFGFAQTSNVNHGGTPGLSRYGIWLVPLTIPLFAGFDALAPRRWLAMLSVTAAVSSTACVMVYAPRFGENYWAPSRLAAFLWTEHPALDNPLPEIFAERLLGKGDTSWLPLATSGCEKVLLVGGDGHDVAWPVPCGPQQAPEVCMAKAALCYANLVDGTYRFRKAPGQPAFSVMQGPVWTWNPATSGAMRRALPNEDWRSLRIVRGSPTPPAVRAFEGISWIQSLQGQGRLLVYLRETDSRASITLETIAPMDVRLVDLEHGDTGWSASSNAAQRDWTLDLPGQHTGAVLVFASR